MMLLSAAAAGSLAGLAHVLLGPDHISAVLPLAVAKPKRSITIGAWWGVGHGLGVVVLGALALVLGAWFDVELASHGAEALVGFLLVGLGLWALRRSRQVVLHSHEHGHLDGGHTHPHLHVGDKTVSTAQHATEGRHDGHAHSALGFGVVHGLAGAGHLLAAAPAMAFGPAASAVYLVFYLGTGIVTMSAVALGAGRLIRKPSWVPRGMAAAGATSVVVGSVWIATFALG